MYTINSEPIRDALTFLVCFEALDKHLGTIMYFCFLCMFALDTLTQTLFDCLEVKTKPLNVLIESKLAAATGDCLKVKAFYLDALYKNLQIDDSELGVCWCSVAMRTYIKHF